MNGKKFGNDGTAQRECARHYPPIKTEEEDSPIWVIVIVAWSLLIAWMILEAI